VCLEISVCRGQIIYSADSKTVTTDTGDVNTSPNATRLFLDNAFSIAAPLGTTIWFVADVNNDGVPAETLGSSQVPQQSVLGPDDRVLFQDVVDGANPGPIAGRYFQTISVTGAAADAAALKNAHIYVYLWNGTGSSFTPTDGSTFGVLNLGVNPPPALGNAFWAIDQNISAAQFTVVPEPRAWGVAMAVLLAGFGMTRRCLLTRVSHS
jgi:hypothetical protein